MILFQVNTPDVSAELFDNEILVINLNSGHYYSMRQAAVPFWLAITNGYSFDFAVTEISKCYNIDESVVTGDFNSLFNELTRGDLIRERNADLAPEQMEFKNLCAGEYQRPILESYTDMKDLILLDPIHEVDVLGWPNKAKTDD